MSFRSFEDIFNSLKLTIVNCRQIFATESDTQCKFVLVCPEDADESNEDPDEST